VQVGDTVIAGAANAGATTVAPTTRVKIFSVATGALLQESVYSSTCSQPLNLGDQFGAMALVGLRTTGGGEVSFDPSQCNTALQLPPPPPHCLGRMVVLRLRYDGGGCAATNNSQAADRCAQLNTSSASPVRIRVTDGSSGVMWLDSGGPAGVELGDVVDVVAASVSGRTALGTDTVVRIYDASNALVEQIKFKTDCSQPMNLGDLFGGLRVVGMRTTNGGTVSRGADVNYTYEIANNGPAAVSNVTVEDDKIGTVPGSPLAPLVPAASVTL